jgi:hypothetical protein
VSPENSQGFRVWIKRFAVVVEALERLEKEKEEKK